MASTNRLLLIDAFSLAFRAFFAFPPTLTLDDGQPINAVYGFATMLFRAIDDLKPTAVCVCFDHPDRTFRHSMYADYKAHRPPAPEEFVVQIPLLHDFLDQLAIQKMIKPGFEADDIIGTLSKLAEENQHDALILTSDQDMLQLLSSHVSVVMNQKSGTDLKIFTPENLSEKYPLTPDQIIDYKALRGDSSDNIPGVKGIGEKTALKLLEEYPTLDEIFDHVDLIKPPGVQKKLVQDKEKAYLSYELAKINRGVPLDASLDAFAYEPNWESILETLDRYSFQTLAKRYRDRGFTDGSTVSPSSDKQVEHKITKPNGLYQLLTSFPLIERLIPLLSDGFAIDLETTSVEALDAQIVGVAIAITEKKGIYIPLNEYLEKETENTLPLFQTDSSDHSFHYDRSFYKTNPVLDVLKPILEDPTIPKYAHHAKYETAVFRNYGIQLKGLTFDTMIAAHILFPGEKIGLKALAEKHLYTQMTTYEDVAGSGKAQIPFAEIPLEKAKRYAGADADYTLRLKHYFESLLEPEQATLLNTIEFPLISVLADMEREGVCIDTGFLKSLSEQFEKELDQLTENIYAEAGETFNINSTQQLGVILFEKKKIPTVKKTKSGYSTDASVLEKLAKDHKIAELMLRYRELKKLKSTYIDSLPKLIHPVTQRIHTTFHQALTATGRLSSANPNLQNIPIRTEQGQKIREAFIGSRKENLILAADYSQIELRLLAQFAQDEAMIKAFQNGEDVHQSTAALVFHVPFDEVTKEQRYQAKAVNFGITYGQKAFGLSEQLGISRTEAKEIIDIYFSKFGSIKAFIDSTIKQAQVDGFVKTEFGRIRPLPDIMSSNKSLRGFAERMAVNTRLQGTAADIIKLAMIQVHDRLVREKLASKMIIQVHDELVLDVVPQEKEAVSQLLKEEMQTVVDYDVPLIVNVASGENWQKT